jgi:UDP-N-acetylmuramoylalanine-D-glutamate ligase
LIRREVQPLCLPDIEHNPDHLDRYVSFDAYARSKQSITKNQGKGQYAILNDDDPLLHDFKPVMM